MTARSASFSRKTLETDIELSLTIDGTGKADVATGIGFFDHMLTLLAFHGGFDVTMRTQGDLHVDAHHTIEDTGIAFGNTLSNALGDKVGIRRYASGYLPMDETLCRTALDISGRAYHVFHCDFADRMIGEFPSDMVRHFFYSVSVQSGLTLHQQILYGDNSHHKAEALFKGFARCLRSAVEISNPGQIQSSKGVL